MLRPSLHRSRTILASVALSLLVRVGYSQEAPAEDRWEKAISEFEKKDKESPPAPGQIVFVGSSSIRLWKLEESFPDLDTLNRGFGGSQVADSVRYADRIVIPYKPRQIVFYAGDNDLAAGKSPEQVRDDFKAFVAKVRAALPEVEIIYLSIKPSEARWKLVEEGRKTNQLIEEFCKAGKDLKFVDVGSPMLGKDGKPRPELYVEDKLHLTPEGYELWASILRPHLAPPKNEASKN
jgi:lysophospholipase L1-like esterase